MSGDFQFDTRPEIDVIVYRHKADCRFVQKEKDRLCRCPKHLYVRLTRARISAKTKSWETARQRKNGLTLFLAELRDRDCAGSRECCSSTSADDGDQQK